MEVQEIEKIVSNIKNEHEADIDKKAVQTTQIVVFKLNTEEYAFKISDIQEIIRIPDITPIPSSPEFISGILNLRGKIIVVIDLLKRFGIQTVQAQELDETKHIIVTANQGNNFGLIVDKVTEVMRIDVLAIQSTPDFFTSEINDDFFSGVVVLNSDKELEQKDSEQKASEQSQKSRLIIILNMQNLLKIDELDMIKNVIDSNNSDSVTN